MANPKVVHSAVIAVGMAVNGVTGVKIDTYQNGMQLVTLYAGATVVLAYWLPDNISAVLTTVIARGGE